MRPLKEGGGMFSKIIKNISKRKGLYSTFDLEQIQLKAQMFNLMGISNYLMQDHECEDVNVTDTQKLWKALNETIDFLKEYMSQNYRFKWNELRYTERELEIMEELKEG